jgi:hypothetical protein
MSHSTSLSLSAQVRCACQRGIAQWRTGPAKGANGGQPGEDEPPVAPGSRELRGNRYAISKATGIAESTLSRFMAGKRGLPMKTLDRLADYLDLDIVARKRRRRKG